MQLRHIKKEEEEEEKKEDEEEQEKKKEESYSEIVEQSFNVYKNFRNMFLLNKMNFSFVVCCFSFLCTCLTISMSPLICQ
jgi:hypothetical protein